VQRISEARIDTETATVREGKEIKIGDDLQTACQQSCPANAIVFGNLNDPNSQVNKWKAQSRNYFAARRTEYAAAHNLFGGSAQSES